MTVFPCIAMRNAYEIIGDDRGMSEDAYHVRQHTRSYVVELSPSLGNQGLWGKVFPELVEVLIRGPEEYEDGYNTIQPDSISVLNALRFLSLLPETIQLPELAFDSDGEVAIEWNLSPRKTISIRVGRDRTLNYAGLDGYAIFKGVEIFDECIPEAISAGIDRIIRDTEN